MKKLVAALLSAMLVVSMAPATVFAADGPSTEQMGKGEYLSFLRLYTSDWEKSYDVFSRNTVNDIDLEGVSYDLATNTLTLTDFNHPELNLSSNMMGDDFTIAVEGECALRMILCWGWGYGGSLKIDGSGSLTLDKDSDTTSAIYLNAESSDSKLVFGKDVTVDLYSTEKAAVVNGTLCDDVDKAIVFEGGEKPALGGERYVYEDGVEEKTLQLSDWAREYGYKVVRASDPDGIYAANYYNGRYDISHYYYIEKFGLPLIDYDFDYTELTEEELEASEYSLVMAAQPETVYYTNDSIEAEKGSTTKKIVKADEPGAVFGAFLGWSGDNYDEDNPDTYYVYKLTWDEDEKVYIRDVDADSTKYSAAEFAAQGYSYEIKDVTSNVTFKAWFDEEDAEKGEDSYSNYDLLTLDSDPEGIYIKYGSYTTSENDVQTDAGYLISKPWYSEEYGGYLVDREGKYGAENFEVPYDTFDTSGFSFVTETHPEKVDIRYLESDYTFESYAHSGEKYKSGDKLYAVNDYRQNGELTGHYVRELTFNEDKGVYYGEEISHSYTNEEFEAAGFEPVLVDRPVQYKTEGSLSRSSMNVAVDADGNKYLVPYYGNSVYDYSEDNSVKVGDDVFYIVTENKDVSYDSLTKLTRMVETDTFNYYIDSKELHYTGTGVRPLFNYTTVNSNKLSLGSRIWITRDAKGGDGNYTYEYYYKRHTARLWTKMGEGLMTDDGAFFTPRAVADFDIKTIVTDGTGQTAEKLDTVSIVDGNSTAFENNSSVNRTLAKPNTRIVLTGAASGSAGYKYAYYYKRSTASVWTRVGTEFGDQTGGTFTPRSEGVFFIKIDIIDENNELVSRNFDLRISNSAPDQEGPANNSTVSATEITAGTKVTVNGAAAGGTGGYTYTYEQKKATANRWNVLGTANTTSTSESFTPRAAGTVDVRITVTDSSGASTVKTFTITVK